MLERTRQFHTDSVLCGLSALALQTNAPTVLRNEALEYEDDFRLKIMDAQVKVPGKEEPIAVYHVRARLPRAASAPSGS